VVLNAMVRLPNGSEERWQFDGRIPAAGEFVTDPDTHHEFVVVTVSWERGRQSPHVPTLILGLLEGA
jgi:hypothetical protein